MELDIVNLIEKNPITKLSKNYQSKLLTKIKNEFSNYEQQLFLSSFFCYVNYNQKTDFLIDLDEIWEWLGFSQKIKARELLFKNYIENIDYRFLDYQEVKQKESGRGGHNIIKIFMTIRTFKSLCLKTGTKKADEIHNYYLKLEEIVQDLCSEETDELRTQLSLKTIELEEKELKLKKEKLILREKTLLEQFPKNTQCIYYGIVDNKSVSNEKLIKFGNSNDLRTRVDTHKKTYSNFYLVNVFKVSNQIQIENAVKQHSILKKHRRNILIDNINYTELLSIEKITFDELDEMIKVIIKENEYNIENYNKLLLKNEELENNLSRVIKENEILSEKIKNLEGKIQEFTPPDFVSDQKISKIGNYVPTKNGYLLYAFECKKDRYHCGIIRDINIEFKMRILKGMDPDGDLKLTHKISFPFSEKIMLFLLRERLLGLGKDTFNGSLDDIKLIFEITQKIEEYIIDKNVSLQDILDNLNKKPTEIKEIYHDPEVPIVRKAKRAIDQINPQNNKIIASYSSIESAGKAIGLTTGTAVGIALRNKTLCQGFIWRYAGISNDDQMKDQPVIKICCSTGEKTNFPHMAAAARDAGISAPGLRNRILTNVHINGHHWIFNKSATHYNAQYENLNE